MVKIRSRLKADRIKVVGWTLCLEILRKTVGPSGSFLTVRLLSLRLFWACRKLAVLLNFKFYLCLLVLLPFLL